MDTKLFARIAAGAFVAVALTMAVLELSEEPASPEPEIIKVWEPDGDPLPAQLRACSAMGELAVSSAECRAAWAEKRRRFLGIENVASPSDPAPEANYGVPPAAEPSTEKGQ